MQNDQGIIGLSLPIEEESDLVIRAGKAGVSTTEFATVKYLQGVYGIFHPKVDEFNNRPIQSISGTKTQEGKS